MMIVRGLLSAAKANMLECDKKMSLSESCDPLKEYLERNRKSVQKIIHWLGVYSEIKRSQLEILG